VLTAECDERDARRRIRLVHEAKSRAPNGSPTSTTSTSPTSPPAALGHLTSGSWIDKSEPLVLLGDPGTGMHCAFLSQG
jgi:hypothetical protein